MRKNKLVFSILIPSYNGKEVIAGTIKSVLAQDYNNFEIIISDDVSTDSTVKIIKSFSDKRLKLFKNQRNLGYPGNLNQCLKHAKGDIVYLLGQDDILAENALSLTAKAFAKSKDIGAVTRPYRWFDEDLQVTVRARLPLNADRDEVVRIDDDPKIVIEVFKSLDSLSALAFRAKFLDRPFHEDIFPCHVYPFASIFKKHPIVFLKDYNLAVRIGSSQTRSFSSVYNKSPIQSWKEMFDSVFYEPEFREIKNKCIKNFVAVNYVGLVQIRN